MKLNCEDDIEGDDGSCQTEWQMPVHVILHIADFPAACSYTYCLEFEKYKLVSFEMGNQVMNR